MARTCTVCSHESRDEIDEAIVEGTSHRAISSQYDISRHAIDRHARDNHMSRAIVEHAEVLEVERADSIVTKMATLESEAQRIGRKAEGAGQYSTALMAVRELVRIVELQARIAGELNEAQVQIAIVNHPDYQRLVDVIGRTLDPYPEAAVALSAALLELEP